MFPVRWLLLSGPLSSVLLDLGFWSSLLLAGQWWWLVCTLSPSSLPSRAGDLVLSLLCSGFAFLILDLVDSLERFMASRFLMLFAFRSFGGHLLLSLFSSQ
ncbi:hypothetical protein QL285_069458 [Trifolium repens]|jgi:hypothetical protein|nr:hypothetical protein QL285_069458 [Trifolium repens]